ncbi:Proton-linked Monocarboxylate Transporter [Abortiporus biennis]
MSSIVALEKCPSHLSTAQVFKTESVLSGTAVGERSIKSLEESQDNTFPEGGLRAWMTVLGAFLALLCTFGQLNSFGTFQTWYEEHQLQHLSPSTISWIGSIQLWIFFFSGGFIGRIFDSYGPRVLMVLGTLILVISTMITSICTQYYEYILCQGILFGIGVGLLFYPSLAAISTHFQRLRGTAMGLAFAGSGVGGVIFPIMLRHLFVSTGFAWGVRISGFISLALSCMACCMVSSRLSSMPKTPGPWFDTKHFKDCTFMLVIIGSAFISLGLFIPNFYIVSYATVHNISPNLSFSILAILNGSSTLGRLAPPCLSDALGRFNLIIPAVFFSGLVTLVFWIFARTTVEIVMYAVLFGFFSGAFNALIAPCVAQISDVREIGMRIGLLYTIVSFPPLASGPAAGALLNLQHGSYTGMIILSGTSLIIGSLFFVWARLRLDRRILVRI